jgi:hypothetical protein
MPSVEWDHVIYRRNAHTVLTWRGNASRFDQVWSSFDQYVVLSCHHYLYNYGREMAASFRTFRFLYSRLEGSYRYGLHRTCSINPSTMFTVCTTQRNVQRTALSSTRFHTSDENLGVLICIWSVIRLAASHGVSPRFATSRQTNVHTPIENIPIDIYTPRITTWADVVPRHVSVMCIHFYSSSCEQSKYWILPTHRVFIDFVYLSE